uniref:Uncharacterized protein n=1 Tax=Agrobacterium tumefaciens TaxID=358 RepID=A0A2P0QJT6_AGRTU|nr:hypothetical protein AgrTiChry5_123 [Agrobacterium tumefaciens]
MGMMMAAVISKILLMGPLPAYRRRRTYFGAVCMASLLEKLLERLGGSDRFWESRRHGHDLNDFLKFVL